MDVPSTAQGRVVEVAVKAGDKVSTGSLILKMEASGAPPRAPAPGESRAAAGASAPKTPPVAACARCCAVSGHRRRRGGPRRARRRSRRLHRGLSCRRPRHEGDADRALADARRRVPERRLHSVEGAAARGEGDRRSRVHGRVRRGVRQATHRHRRVCATGRTRWWRA